jgi:hypothetical protein
VKGIGAICRSRLAPPSSGAEIAISYSQQLPISDGRRISLVSTRASIIALLLASVIAVPLTADSIDSPSPRPTCRWWQFGPCPEVPDPVGEEGLPPEAPRVGVVISVDVATNTAYLYRDGALVRKSAAATGADRVLKSGSKIWLFRTPRGRHTVLRKVTNPIWRKPDWAFVEDKQKIPPANSPLREERGKMGKYALDLGDGIMLHGTDDPKSIGKRVSHGCIRLPAGMLTEVYKSASVGTEVWIFDSKPSVESDKWREQLRVAMIQD